MSGVIKFENLKMSITTKPPTGRLKVRYAKIIGG